MSCMLGKVNEGSNVKVVDMLGGSMCLKKLSDLGILKNENIKIKKNNASGPIVIEVKGVNIALGRGISNKILVEVNNR